MLCGALGFINSLADSLAGDVTILGVPKVAKLHVTHVNIVHVYFLES